MPAPKGNKNAKNNKGGRPVKYKEAFCEAIIKFFTVQPSDTVVVEESKEYFANGRLRKHSQKKKLVPNKMPTLFGFAEKIKVSRETLRDWGKKHVEFSGALKRAKEYQKEFLMTNGLSGASPSPAYIFTAKNVTDMRDKIDVKQDVNASVKQINMPTPYARGNDGYTATNIVAAASRAANGGPGV